MISMSDTLPTQPAISQTSPGAVPVTGSLAKEAEPHISIAESPVVEEIGKEIDLPKEVQQVGVTLAPTTVEFPPNIAAMGVSAVGPQAVSVSSEHIVLPLTDDQIAKGLHQSIMSSWRWLAQWCVRQLQKAHTAIRPTAA